MTDIVASTEHAAELGDRAWRELLQLHHAAVRKALRRHEGREIDTAGDGFFAVFDAPANAVDCALEIVEQVAQLGVQVRSGIHAGEVEQVGKKVGGITVHIAARIMAEAGPGEVLASSTIHDLSTGAGWTFEDRGSHALRGVPGVWHLYSVRDSRPSGATPDAEGGTGAAEELPARRSAAVRRSRSRSVIRRRPRATAVVAVAVAVILATAAMLVWQPWLKPALAAIPDNSVGMIETARNVITAAVEVGQRPGGAIVSDGSLWVTNTGSDTVSEIQRGTETVTRIVDVGKQPIGIIATPGSIWVANSGSRSISQINTSSARVVNEVPVGNGPTALASSTGYIWVANAGDSTVMKVDPANATVIQKIPVAARPIAIAADDLGVWVASADAAAVTHLDPHTGVTLAPPISVGGLPVGIAVGSGAVWVATTDGNITRIDPATNRVTSSVNTGGSPSAIAADDHAVWVADRDGFVLRFDPSAPADPPTRIHITSSPEALALSDGSVWVTTRASPASHRGGTLNVLYAHLPTLDPAGLPDYSLPYLEADGLVGYQHVGGIAGSTLLPDLAITLPHPSNGGLTYTFQLRPGLQYSTGEPVQAADFRRAIERVFDLGALDVIDRSPHFETQFRAIQGAQQCLDNPDRPCDLALGIVTDEQSRTVTFNLADADPDFLYKLSLSGAFPVPESVPMDQPVAGAFPGTGPYVVSSVTDTEVRLTRSPNFHPWDKDVRPDGYPDEIVWTTGVAPADQLAMIENGTADWMPLRGDNRITPEQFAALRGGFASQLQVASKSVNVAWMNTALAPFDNLSARQAVNMAVDRAHAADLYGGPLAVSITCQNLPPGWLGYEPYCPYTTNPDPGGRWQAPDLDSARALVELSGTKGAHVVVGPVRERHAPLRDYVASVLQQLGYDAVADTRTDDASVFGAIGDGIEQIGVFEYFAGTPAPSEFFVGNTCDRSDGLSNYCSADFDQLYSKASNLQTTDMAAAADAWGELDRLMTDAALTAPLVNEGTDFLSSRVGNYQFSPALGVLLDQLWVQ